jgi:hypothetical protein
MEALFAEGPTTKIALAMQSNRFVAVAVGANGPGMSAGVPWWRIALKGAW